MTRRVITHRVVSAPVVALPEALAGLRDQHGTLGLIGFLAQLEQQDADRRRRCLEPTPAADAAQMADALWALWAFLAQACRRHEPACRAPTRPEVDVVGRLS
jgi:hypothetical protein